MTPQKEILENKSLLFRVIMAVFTGIEGSAFSFHHILIVSHNFGDMRKNQN